MPADGVEVLFTPGLWVPLVNIRSTYILPGIPHLFQQMVEAHAGRFKGPAAHTLALFTNMGEGDLAAKLGGIAALHPAVRIGSYPNTAMGLGEPAGGQAYKVRPGGGWTVSHVGGHATPPVPVAVPLPLPVVLPPAQVKLQFESRDKAALQKAADAVREALDTFTLPAGTA